MNTPVRRDGNVLYLFGREPEADRTTAEIKLEESLALNITPTPRGHPLDEYLAFLHSRNFITAKEMVVLVSALEPVRAHFKGLSTVDLVRDELRATSVTVDSLRRAERHEWEENNFLWLDLEAALDHFMVKAQDAERYMKFLNDAARAAQGDFIDPELYNAETFFWIVLRMYRLHAASAPEDSVAPIEDAKIARLLEDKGNEAPTPRLTQLLRSLIDRWRKPS